METAPSPTTPEEEARGSHVLAAIDSELRRLEPWQAEAVELHCMRGVSQQEVARRIDRSRYAVRMSVNRLRRVVEKRIA